MSGGNSGLGPIQTAGGGGGSCYQNGAGVAGGSGGGSGINYAPYGGAGGGGAGSVGANGVPGSPNFLLNSPGGYSVSPVTSTSSVLVGTGSKTFTINSFSNEALSFLGVVAGSPVVVYYTNGNSINMTGTITSISSTTLICSITSVGDGASSSYSTWRFSFGGGPAHGNNGGAGSQVSAGAGGSGLSNSLSGSSLFYAAGGGGGGGTPANGGSSIGGNGSTGSGSSATSNRGSGGGGGGYAGNAAGAGGSGSNGIVIVRYLSA